MTPTPPNNWKRRVHKRFDRHATQYAEGNHVQRQVAKRLVGFLPDRAFARILEIGCGDGSMTAILAERYPNSQITASDISPRMLNLAKVRLDKQSHVRFEIMDGEDIVADAPYDLIISNMTSQWFIDLPAALQKWQSCLTADGMILTSRPGAECFAEWRNALQAEKFSNGLVPAQATPYQFDEDFIAVDCPDTLSFLRDLRRSGVTTGRDGHKPLSLSALKRACSRCDQDSDGAMTWHIVYERLARA